MKKINRHSVRLKGYDYSSDGLYFITICTQGRLHLFGEIDNGIMNLNDCGRIVFQCWQDIPDHFPDVILHDFVIMPNHIHFIIQISRRGEKFFARPSVPNDKIPENLQFNGTSHTVGSIIRGLKIGITLGVRQLYPEIIVWQRNYYEHIIRTQQAYENIACYIYNNPVKWEMDCFNGGNGFGG